MKFTKTLAMMLSAMQMSSVFSLMKDLDMMENYVPDRLSYDHLLVNVSDKEETTPLLLDALSSEGLISITDVPNFASNKRSLLRWLHACILDQGSNAENVLETIQKDGTIRRTFASVTVPGAGGDQDFELKGKDESALSSSCQEFSNNLKEFRSQVAEVTSTFSKGLTMEMEGMYNMPLMSTKDGAHSFHTLEDVVSSGEHLEHFHSYQKIEDSSKSPLRSHEDEEGVTIDMHTDQGFFIAFVPGLMVSHVEADEGSTLQPDLNSSLDNSNGFYIQRQNGDLAHVQFDQQDDIVFMMGDGVNQYINPMMKHPKTLRATPHYVSLSSHEDNLSRVWYGRMVLPPQAAFHSKDNKTYGQIRSEFTKIDISPGSLGCSTTPNSSNTSQNSSSTSTSRFLSAGHSGHSGTTDTSCADGHIFCWARCMNLEEHDAHTCTERNLKTQCINPRDQVSPGNEHGDFYPGCSDTEEVSTPYPTLDDYPRADGSCTDDAWETFSTQGDYDHIFDLATDSTSAKFMWSVVDGKVHGRLAFNGLFGYLALGLANLEEGAGHNGMNGANILMAKPSEEYSAVTGFDFSADAIPQVSEHKINQGVSAFRTWQEPITDSTSMVMNTEIDNVEKCFTSFSFEADGINSQAFQTDGSDVLIWAGNTKDKFAGYHGLNRGKFNVNWATGAASFFKAQSTVTQAPTPAPKSGASTIALTSSMIILVSIIAFLL